MWFFFFRNLVGHLSILRGLPPPQALVYIDLLAKVVWCYVTQGASQSISVDATLKFLRGIWMGLKQCKTGMWQIVKDNQLEPLYNIHTLSMKKHVSAISRITCVLSCKDSINDKIYHGFKEILMYNSHR